MTQHVNAQAFCLDQLYKSRGSSHTERLRALHAFFESHGALDVGVYAALRQWLADEGHAALARLPAADRGSSVLLHSLARMLEDQGTVKEAELLYVKSLEARRMEKGSRNPSTLIAMNNLAGLLRAQSKLEAEPLRREDKLGKAELLRREVLEARREVLGARHPDTLIAMNNLATLLQSQHRLNEAEPLCREVLEAQREVLRPRHPDTLTSIHNLASLLYIQGSKLDEAEAMFREALEARREVLGPRHPHTLTTMNNLAGLLKAKGKRDEAEAMLREVLEARRDVLGPRHADTIAVMKVLGLE